MDDIFGVEVKQPFTHADDDSAFIGRSQLQGRQFEIKFSQTVINTQTMHALFPQARMKLLV